MSVDGVTVTTTLIDATADDGALLSAALMSSQSPLVKAGFTEATYDNSGTALCVSNAETNHTITVRGPLGNAPLIQIHRSNGSLPDQTIRVYTDHGRSSDAVLCNGIGQCDDGSGKCSCPAVSAFIRTFIVICSLLCVRDGHPILIWDLVVLWMSTVVSGQVCRLISLNDHCHVAGIRSDDVSWSGVEGRSHATG